MYLLEKFDKFMFNRMGTAGKIGALVSDPTNVRFITDADYANEIVYNHKVLPDEVFSALLDLITLEDIIDILHSDIDSYKKMVNEDWYAGVIIDFLIWDHCNLTDHKFNEILSTLPWSDALRVVYKSIRYETEFDIKGIDPELLTLIRDRNRMKGVRKLKKVSNEVIECLSAIVGNEVSDIICGEWHRTIYVKGTNPNIIRIGCFEGTEEYAVKAVEGKYKPGNVKDKYVESIRGCFRRMKKSDEILVEHLYSTLIKNNLIKE